MTLEQYKTELCITVGMLLNQINIARGCSDLINISYIEKINSNVFIKGQECETLKVYDCTLERYTKELFLKGCELLINNDEDDSLVVQYELKLEMSKSIQMILKQVTLGKNKNIEVKIEYIERLNKVNIKIDNKEDSIDVTNLNTKDFSAKILISSLELV